MRESICKYAPWEVRWVGKLVALAYSHVEVFHSNSFSPICANFGHFGNVAITYCARPRQPSPGWGHGCAAWRGGQRAMEGGWWLMEIIHRRGGNVFVRVPPFPGSRFLLLPWAFGVGCSGFSPLFCPPPRSVFVFGLGLSPGRSPRGVTFSPQRFVA